MALLIALPTALCFIVFVFPTLIRGLTITPNASEIILPPHARIELMCEHDQPVSWSFEEETPTENVIRITEGNWAKLIIENASYLNVKSYTCSSTEPTDEQSIYVFIRDVDHLLVAEDEQNIISFYTSEHVIVPCKPSFPDVQVKLLKVADSEIVAYDNKRGFTVRLHEAKHIECVGTFRTPSSLHSTSVMYEAEQMHQPEEIQTPDIELVGRGPNDHVVVGQNATLRCSLMTPPGVHHDFYWSKPKTIKPDDDRFAVDTSVRIKYPPNSNQPYNLATSNLFIRNVQKTDEGYYKCTVSAGLQESSFTYNFQVYGETQVFLNLTPVGSLTYTSRPGKAEVVLVANIDAHPIPEITWYGPDNQKIVPNKKYNITGDMESTHLIVYTPTTSDIGNYTVVAKNRAGSHTLRYVLHIEGEPLVEIPQSPKAYLLKTKQNVMCHVVGYPKPKVEMTFRPCPDLEHCSSPEIPLQVLKSCQTPPVSCNYTATLSITQRGNLFCSASNRLGNGNATSVIHITDVPNEFHVYNTSMGNGEITDVNSIELECGASKNSYMNDLVWKFRKHGDNISIVLEEEVLEEKDGIHIKRNETDLSFWSKLSIEKPRIDQSGVYTCSGKYKKDHSISSISTIIRVLPSVAPRIHGSTANNSHHDVSPGGPITWQCDALGNPLPSYIWYKNEKIPGRKGERIVGHNKTFSIDSVQLTDEGTYRCEASNQKGSVSLVFNLKIKKKEGSIFQWVGIGVCSTIILVCIVIVIIQRKRIKQEKKAREEVFSADLYFIREGNVEYINPNLDIADQAEFLPYNQAWEFPIEKLKLGKQLGFGAFGVVMKAEATGLRNDEEKTVVAVKMVKKNSDVDLIKALASELKIMANLGQHVNVVNLLGACTRNIANRELLVIVEFCKFGNLHDFLLTHRDSFINQVNPGSGNLEIIPSDNSMGFPVGVSRSNSDYRGGSAYDTAGSNCATVTTDMTLLSTPIGEDGYLINNSQHYQGDFQQTEKKTICTQDLLCWGFQIAKGMEYLASRKVLHGDLAARNVLLAENNVVKICDFGLAKSMYKKEIYTKAGNELLPIKWMSVEALEDRVFSTQSDIWAYGIVLWELFTLSRTPYPGVQPSDVLTLLRSGYRMEKPEYATEDVYNVMIECWNKSPMLRPSFTECAERLGNMLEESVKQHYMDLNNPYVEFNSNQPNGRDYLSILNPPTYVNCTSDHNESYVGNDYTPMQFGQRYKNDREKDAVELRPMLPQPGQTNIFNPGYEGLGHMVACTN